MKTGGTTFRYILSSIYGASFHVIENPEFDSVASMLQKFDCIEFHTLPYKGDFAHMHTCLGGERRWNLLRRTDIFAMFRDPVEQAVSMYFHMMQRRAFVEPVYKLNGIPFPETIDQYLDNPIHLNNQLAFLLGKYRLKPGNDLIRAHVEEAKEMIVKLNIHPGLTERFAESLHVFETVTGRRVPGGKIVNQNKNRERLPLEAISARTRDRIRDLSWLDNELYTFASDILRNNLEQCGPVASYTFIDMAASRPAGPAANAGPHLQRSAPPLRSTPAFNSLR